MRTLQCTVPAAFDGRPLKHLLRGELGISSTLLKTCLLYTSDAADE